MNKPSKKSEWVELAIKLNVIVDAPDTVPEIIKNIADELGVSSRGKNFNNRVWEATELALSPMEGEVPIEVKNDPTPIVVDVKASTKVEKVAPKFVRHKRARRHNPMNFKRS